MAKRVKVQTEPVVYSNLVHAGACARNEGRPLDHIEYTLLRTPDLKASWRKGWQDRDAELARLAQGAELKPAKRKTK